MRSILPPILLLAALCLLALGNARIVSDVTDRCVLPLDEAAALADSGNWPGAREALSRSEAQWQRWRSYLRITATHTMVDAVDSMYHRSRAFGETEELTEFRAEAAGLRAQLLHMAETEGFHLENIL